MRRIEHLINDIRFASNQVDTNRFKDVNLIKFFNDAQRAIQAIIFMADNGSSIFDTEALMDIVAQQETYSLPSDIYAVSSVNSIGLASSQVVTPSNYRYQPLRKLSIKERRSQLGYILQNKSFLLSPAPQGSVTDGIRINYVRRLPTLSFRIGKVASFVSGTSITLAAGFSTDLIGNYDDYVTVVDSDGVIKQSGVLFTSYAAGVILTPTALTSIAADDYIVLGKVATSHPELPDETEALLTSFVHRKINGVDSSPEISDTDLFTEEEKNLINSLFSKKDHDVKYPPITDSTYMNT